MVTVLPILFKFFIVKFYSVIKVSSSCTKGTFK